MLRATLCLLLALPSVFAVAQETPEATPETLDGWIVGAKDQVLRIDPDGSWYPIHQIRGLKHLRVIPGTATVIAAGDDGVFMYKEDKWVSVYTGGWDRLEYSMNYRALSIEAGDRLHVKQLLPEVADIEAYATAPGGARLGLGQTVLPSGHGELVFPSGEIRFTPADAPIKVYAQTGGQQFPVQFVASGDDSGFQFGTIAYGNSFWLLRLDVKGRGQVVTPQRVLGETARPSSIVVPLRQEDVLTQLTAAIDRVVPAPAPYLAFLVGERIQWVNTDNGMTGTLPVTVGDPLRQGLVQAGIMSDHSERRLGAAGRAWHVASVAPPCVLAIQPASLFSPLALHGSGRACSVTGVEPEPVMIDCMGIVGFGAYKWPATRPAPAIQPPRSTAQLERRDLAAVEGELPEALLVIYNKVFAAMPDGSLQERSGSVFGPGQEWLVSPDHETLLVNAKAGAERNGPCYVFRRGGCLMHPVAGDLSADGKRVWFRDRQTLESYNSVSGELSLTLGLPPEPGGPPVQGLRVSESGGRVFLADEGSRRWIAVARLWYPETETKPLWLAETPEGGMLLCEHSRQPSGHVVTRLHSMPQTEVGNVLGAAYLPILSDAAVASSELLAPAQPDAAVALQNVPLVFTSARVAWAAGSRFALVEVARGHEFARLLLARKEGLSIAPLPNGYSYAGFTADGESILAVVDQRIVDATAPDGRQVLAKISLDSGQIVWSSQPFANCRAMVPHPAFDLKVFHDATGSGL